MLEIDLLSMLPEDMRSYFSLHSYLIRRGGRIAQPAAALPYLGVLALPFPREPITSVQSASLPGLVGAGPRAGGFEEGGGQRVA
jgi:hypothetical protein